MAGFSIEATRPSAADIAALAVPEPGTRVYLSAIPNRPADESVATAVQVRAAGLEPVPHVAVRNFASEGALDDFLAQLNGEAGVDSVLVIAGDRSECGPFRRALDAIERRAAPTRYPHHRHRRISRGPSTHRRGRAQPRAEGKDRRR
jgi:methylenetetrahydrofolate reductase (NADPH)